jgi:hypothetical protein
LAFHSTEDRTAWCRMNDYYNPRMIIIELEKLFPKSFFDEGRMRRPLKVDIVTDIVSRNEGALRGLDIARALGWYCGHYGYLKTLLAGAPRIDLDGKTCGTVTQQEAREALAEIFRLNEEKAARGEFNPHDSQYAPPAREKTVKTIPPIAPPLTDSDLLRRASLRIKRLWPIIDGEDEDGLRAETAAPLLKSLHEDVKTLYDRLR